MCFAPGESLQNVVYAMTIFPIEEFKSSTYNFRLSIEKKRFIFFNGTKRQA